MDGKQTKRGFLYQRKNRWMVRCRYTDKCFGRRLNERGRITHQILLRTEQGITTSYRSDDGHLRRQYLSQTSELLENVGRIFLELSNISG